MQTEVNREHSHTTSLKGLGGFLIYVKKGGWVVSGVMPYFSNNLIFSTFGPKIASLALSRKNLAARLKIIWQSDFDSMLAIFTSSFSPFPIEKT